MSEETRECLERLLKAVEKSRPAVMDGVPRSQANAVAKGFKQANANVAQLIRACLEAT